MAIAMLGYWKGMTREQYEQAVERINGEEQFPSGMKLHSAGFERGGMRVFDIWESEHAYKQFLQRRILPAIRASGFQGEPELKFFPIHNVYIPGLEELGRVGASMLPA